MGLYRVEGGCLYRIKIPLYLGAPATAASAATGDRALGRLTLHEFRDDRRSSLFPPFIFRPFTALLLLLSSLSVSLFFSFSLPVPYTLQSFIFTQFREASRTMAKG